MKVERLHQGYGELTQVIENAMPDMSWVGKKAAVCDLVEIEMKQWNDEHPVHPWESNPWVWVIEGEPNA